MTVTGLPHLTGISALSPAQISRILDRIEQYDVGLKDDEDFTKTLHDKQIVFLFFENSTRTRTSFEMAAYKLGANTIHWDAANSSLAKGESFQDTILNINAMRPDSIIVRHHDYGAPHYMAEIVDCPVINAGDSWNEHPTQALLDAYTLKQKFGSLDGLQIAICGDIAHSRVAKSNIILLSKMGVHIHAVAPEFLMPEKLPADGIHTFDSLEEGLKGCDAIMMLRNQKERMEAGLIKSDEEFFRQYGLTKERLAIANKDAVVLHPGPMNRNVEIADAVADDADRSLILKQVSNGIPTRMAVMDMLINKAGA